MRGETFAADSPYKMRVEVDVAPACESARRSLLGQGYLIESADQEGVKARKATRGGDTQNTFIEMTVVCLPDPRGSTLFATGVLTTYDLKKSSSSAACTAIREAGSRSSLRASSTPSSRPANGRERAPRPNCRPTPR